MTNTKGNVIVEKIKIGDIHYEYEYNMCVVSEVLTKPELNENNCWVWKSKRKSDGKIIDYLVDPKYTHYSSNLYDYKAYNVKYYI